VKGGGVVVLDHGDVDMAARIVEVQRAAYAVEAQLIGFDRIPPLLEAPGDVARLDLVLLGFIEGGILHGLVGFDCVGDVVDVDRLAVRPPAFRQGIGRALLEDLHRRHQDAARFEVSTAVANVPALPLRPAGLPRAAHEHGRRPAHRPPRPDPAVNRGARVSCTTRRRARSTASARCPLMRGGPSSPDGADAYGRWHLHPS
jgi:GNAT superfamily N-acetyltransferase